MKYSNKKTDKEYLLCMSEKQRQVPFKNEGEPFKSSTFKSAIVPHEFISGFISKLVI